MVATKQITFQFKNIWQPLVAICLIAVWAAIGNGVYNNVLDSHYDWFFLTGSTFPFVPPLLMPIAVISAVFGMVALIYGIYYGFCHFVSVKEINQPPVVTELAPTTSEEK